MKKVKDFEWKPNMKVSELVDGFSSLGYQSLELNQAYEVVLKMKRSGAKIFLTFTSNMVTSGLRGFFAQLCDYKIPDILVTTSGSIEEDIMKSLGEEFKLSDFFADDTQMHEEGENRIGNLAIRNESYMRFEDTMNRLLQEIYDKKKRLGASELLKEIGLLMKKYEEENPGSFPDVEKSILYQAAKNDIPVYCPGIADSSFGFHLFMFQQKNDDFIVDTIKDMKRVVSDLSFDDKKGLIALGGSISKHYAVFSSLLSGGFDYAVYLTTSHASSGSMSGATTREAKSWGKIKDDAEASTVNGDVTITFPMLMTSVLDKLNEQGFLSEEGSGEKNDRNK